MAREKKPKPKPKPGPVQVLDMLIDCYQSEEAGGFESADNVHGGGGDLSWYDPKIGGRPQLRFHTGREAVFEMPDGRLVKVKATWMAGYTLPPKNAS